MAAPHLSAVQRVIHHVKEIAVARSGSGDCRLPSEEAICDAVGVSRGPVREAIKVLEALGAVEIRRGIGTYVVPQGIIALEYIQTIQALSVAATAKDMFEVRLMLEREAALYAAQRRDQSDLDRMEAANELMRELSVCDPVDLDALTAADVEFHKAIYDAARNPLLGTIGKLVTELVAPMIREGHARVGGMRSVLNHQQVLGSISAGDAGAAQEAVDLRPVYLGLERWQMAIADPDVEPQTKSGGMK